MSKEQEELRDALRKIKKLVCGDKAPRWANDDAVFDTRGIIADICEIADMPRAFLANEGVQELVKVIKRLGEFQIVEQMDIIEQALAKYKAHGG
jgi:hypothetical protein